MNTFLLLLGIGVALATPSGDKAGTIIKPDKEFVIKKAYPEVITDFEVPNYAELPIEELLQLAAEHPGLEYLNDINATTTMDTLNLHPDLIEDALSTTVRYIF